VRLDLSAVAKGYAVDLVADLLEMLALPDYLVEVGGEMRLGGSNTQGKPWRIAVEQPSVIPQVQRIIELGDVAMATSGDYRNYFKVDGVRYSHTIDPRTGRPITHSLASVTVLAPTCAEADAQSLCWRQPVPKLMPGQLHSPCWGQSRAWRWRNN